MIQEALTTAGQVVHNHWAGGISGAAIVHILYKVGPWLKENGTIKGVWASYIWAPKPTVKDSLPVQPEPPKP
jgi:hypothetical protein